MDTIEQEIASIHAKLPPTGAAEPAAVPPHAAPAPANLPPSADLSTGPKVVYGMMPFVIQHTPAGTMAQPCGGPWAGYPPIMMPHGQMQFAGFPPSGAAPGFPPAGAAPGFPPVSGAAFAPPSGGFPPVAMSPFAQPPPTSNISAAGMPGGGIAPAAAAKPGGGMPPSAVPPSAGGMPGGGMMPVPQMMAAAARYDMAKDVYKKYFNERYAALQKMVASAAGNEKGGGGMGGAHADGRHASPSDVMAMFDDKASDDARSIASTEQCFEVPAGAPAFPEDDQFLFGELMEDLDSPDGGDFFEELERNVPSESLLSPDLEDMLA